MARTKLINDGWDSDSGRTGSLVFGHLHFVYTVHGLHWQNILYQSAEPLIDDLRPFAAGSEVGL